MCKQPIGCDVGKELLAIYPDMEVGEAIAGDMAINELIDKFVSAKVLFDFNGVQSLFEIALSEIGLLEDPQLLLSLEIIYRKAKNERAKSSTK